jgi:hypothetical protein
MLRNTHCFSIENLINPETGEPFGPKFTGIFNIRRASLRDREMAEQKEAAERNAFGVVPAGQVPPELAYSAHIFHYTDTIATEELPPWFDRAKIYDEDEPAIVAVWNEVQKFQDSFRRPASGTVGTGTGGESPVLVSPEV